ncbi:MAG: hypothetical protein WCK02_15355 [Bacteroidota bacterium]
MSVSKKFKWYVQDNNQWVGILELKENDLMETYRIKIETETVQDLNYSHYKFHRFNYSSREWVIDFTKSNYPNTVYRTIKSCYLEHIFENNVENVLLTYKTKDFKRHPLNRYFCKILEAKGYCYIEIVLDTFVAMLCYKDIKLIKRNERGEIETYLRDILSKYVFDE